MLSATHCGNSVKQESRVHALLISAFHLNIKLQNQKNEKAYFLDGYWLWASLAADFFRPGIRAQFRYFSVHFYPCHVCLPFIYAHASSWQFA